MDGAELLLLLRGNATGALKAIAETGGALGQLDHQARDRASGISSTIGGAAKTAIMATAGIGLVIGGIGLAAAKMAGDYESATNRLVTSAGESRANLDLVRKGMLDMAGQVGMTADQLAKGMYIIESGGYHGAAGLQVLKAAAQGAKTENADLATVGNAVTSVLNDYHLPASKAADVTSKLVAAVGQGKTTFQEMTGSLHSVLPLASAAGISLSDITGALASMTMHGYSAEQATQNLSHTIQHMQSVTAPQSKELAALGLSARDLAQHLGERGLTGTLQTVDQAIRAHMGPGQSQVVLNLLDAVKKLPPAVRDLATQAADGSITMGQYTKAAKGLTVEQAGQAMGFATLLKQTHGLGQDQKAGGTILQNYAAALKAATGDSTTLNTALMLTGENTAATNANVKIIAGTTTEAGNNVAGWSSIQGTFNQKLDRAKGTLSAVGVTIGTALLPMLGQAVSWFADKLPAALAVAQKWFKDHQQQIKDVGQSLKDLAQNVGKVVAVAFSGLVSVLGFVSDHFTIVKAVAIPLLTVLVAFMVVQKVAAAFDAMSKAAHLVHGAYMLMTAGAYSASGAEDALAVSEAAALGWMLLIAVAIAAVIGVAYLLITHWKQIDHWIGEIGNKIKGFFIAAWRDLEKVVGAVGGWFARLPGEVGRHLASLGGSIKQHLNDAGAAILHFGQHIWKVITDAVGRLVQYVKTEIPKLPMDIARALGTAVGTVIGFGIRIWNWASTEIPKFVGAVVGFIAALPGRIWNEFLRVLAFYRDLGVRIWNWAITEIPKFVEGVIGFLAGLPGRVWGVFTGVIGFLLNLGSRMWGWATTAIPAFIGSVIGFLAGLPGKVWAQFMGVMDKLGQFGASMMAWVGNNVPNVISSFTGFFSALPGKMMGIGRDAIQGLINGVQHMAGAVAGAVGGLIGGFLDSAKKAAGIKSPSTVFADQVGAPISQGVAVGITRAGSQVHGSLAKVLSSMAGQAAFGVGFNITGTGGAGGGPSGTGSGGGPSISQVINITALPEAIVAQVNQAIGAHNHDLIQALTAGQSRVTV